MGRSIGYKDQDFGGSFNAHKNWKKLRDKHQRVKKGEKWQPERYETRAGAGKGDESRPSSVPKEIYDLNYELAFGKITKEEHKKMVEKFWEDFTNEME